MKRINNKTNKEIVDLLTSRSVASYVQDAVTEIISSIRDSGDSALCEYSRKFDGVDSGIQPKVVTKSELESYVDEIAESMLTDKQKLAIETAVANVQFCAQKSQPKSWSDIAPQGHTVGETFTPYDRVACYVPQGSFPLVSTAIHTGAIASAVGVREIAMITSPSDDDLNPAVAYAAYKSGFTEIVYAGGAQGIAALAYGTQTISRADFICGPGNQYVAEAKRQCYGDVGIDMVAGPSEVYVLTDETPDPYAVACDLVAQAEHGSGYEAAVLLTTSEEMIDKVEAELEKIKVKIKDNSGFLQVLDSALFLVKVNSIEDAIAITNECAPEHVEVFTINAKQDASKVVNAGAVFIGELSAEPLGDFVAGPSHVLPTNSSARFSSGLSAASFFRRTSIIEFTKESYDELAPLAYEFAQMEGLVGHGLSSVARLENNE